jgi:hypothetical protein
MDFPSRSRLLTAPVFPVRIRSLSGTASSVERQWSNCWAILVLQSPTAGLGLPNAVSSRGGSDWWIVLINADNGRLQESFSGHSVLRLSLLS